MIPIRHYSLLDHCLTQLDKGVRTVFSKAVSARPNPAQDITKVTSLSEKEKRHNAGLMRVNHAGEISAQALYHAQALTARSLNVQIAMEQAASEENDHLAWCEQRLSAFSSHTSYLNPFWYVGSFGIGLCAGLAGDRWSLGFLAETEKQVVKHLNKHLKSLSISDIPSRKILVQMREDEACHATTAYTAGANELPQIIKVLMRLFSKVMTTTAYWI